MQSFKNISVIGIGGVGGYFGGKLAYALSQNNPSKIQITFVARGAHFEKIKESGLNLISEEGHFVCKPDFIFNKIEYIPIPDLVLLCVKSYDLENSIKQLEKVIHKETIILPLLNGVDIYDRIKAVSSNGIVLPSCVYVASYISEPGTVLQKGHVGTIISGNVIKDVKIDQSDLTELFKNLNIHFKWVDEPFQAIWEKYTFVASFAVVTAYSGKTFVEVSEIAEYRILLREVMNEIISIAKASGIKISNDIFETSTARASSLSKDSKTSYQRDVEKGSRNEGDIFGKTIIEKGKLFNIPTPTTERLFNEIQKTLINK